MLRVQSNLIGRFSVSVPPTVAREVAVGSPLPLQRYEARRQLILEQAAIEVVVGLLKLGVGGAGGFGHGFRAFLHRKRYLPILDCAIQNPVLEFIVEIRGEFGAKGWMESARIRGKF